MTGSRVKWFVVAAAFGVILPAAAQWVDNKPPVLGPGDYPPEATEDPPDQPAKGEATGAPQQLPGAGIAFQAVPAGSVPVEVGALGSPEGPPVGTLAATGGLGEHLWSGSDRAKVEDLLRRAPLVSGDPVLRDLVRRVVLTKAAPPPGQSKKPFLAMRIERLVDAGLVPEAGALAAMAAIPNDSAFARLQAETVLIANRAADACGPATAARLTESDPFWMQLRAYCAAAAGDEATAELTRQVVKAQGRGDAVTDALIDAALAKKVPPPLTFAEPTALHVFLYQQTGAPLPEAIARKRGTPENLLVMRDTRHPPPVRLEAAERIVATGAATPGELVKLADAQDLPLARVAGAAAEAPNLPFLAGQVLLRRAAGIETRPDEKAKLIAQGLALGETYKLPILAAAFQADAIASLKPQPALGGYARSFARALMLAGRAETAAAWTGGDPVLKAVVALASGNPQRLAAIQADLSAFAVSLGKNPPDRDADRSTKALILGLADLTGAPMPADAKAAAVGVESAMWDGARPGPGLMRTIVEIAGAPERRGEAILMLAGTIRTVGLKDMAPDATFEFVRLLTDINETEPAKALAAEALAAYVPPALPVLPALPVPQAPAQ